MELLQMSGIHKRFGSTHALRGVELTLTQGEVLAVIGENGAGKSTLMKILSGALQPDAGDMRLAGARYAPRHPADARRAGVAMIYQELSLAPHLTVAENIGLGHEPTWGPFVRQRQLRDRALRALAAIDGQDLPWNRPTRQLSLAQQQRVEIARAVALDARVIVFDEPTSSLTQRDVPRLFRLIRQLQSQGIGVIYISHFLEEVAEIAQRYTILRDGQTVGSGALASTPMPDIIRTMVGREVHDLYPERRPPVGGETLLEVNQLQGMRKPISATFSLKRGTVLGIAGLVGAGRTAMMRSLFGLAPVRSGQVRIAQLRGPSASPTRYRNDARQATPALRWQQGVGMVSEDRKAEGLALGLSIADNLTLSRLQGLGPANWVWPSRQRNAARHWIEALRIKCQSPSQPIYTLSGGNQQKVAIARLLHARADLWLLDEPTRGIDLGAKAQIYQLIHDLAQGTPGTQRPAAIVLASSYLPELLGVCHEIAVMTRGRLSDIRPAEEWTERELMRLATGFGDDE